MRRRAARSRSSRSADKSGFLGIGHYPIPVLEESLGLASPDTTVFRHDAGYIYRVLEVTFDSILTQSRATNAAVGRINTERRYETAAERAFSLAVMDVLRHLRADFQVLADERVGNSADFGIAYKGGEIFVETRWHAGFADESAEAALTKLVDGLPDSVAFLLVVDSDEPPSPKSYELIAQRLHGRGGIVAWEDGSDTTELASVLLGLIEE